MSELSRHYYLILNAQDVPVEQRRDLCADIKLRCHIHAIYKIEERTVIAFYGTEHAAGRIYEHFRMLQIIQETKEQEYCGGSKSR